MLGLRHELADRHVFDHAPAQRADGLVGHGGAPVLSEVVEHLDLRTGRFHRLRLLIITRAAPQAPYRERFSPLAPSGGLLKALTRSLSEAQRTCREIVGRVDPTLLTPMYGPAVRCKRFRRSWRCGLASMYPASDWSICSRPSWISARMRSNYRRSLERAVWVTSVHTRRECDSPSSSHPLADLGG